MALTSIKTQDAAYFSAARKMIPLRMQIGLSVDEINYVAMKTLKWDENQIKEILSIDPKLYALLKQKTNIKEAISCLEKMIVSGVGAAAEMGEAAEVDIITRFHEIAMSDSTEFSDVFKFGKAILDHQAKLARAFSLKAIDSNLPKRLEVIDMKDHGDVLQRLELRAGQNNDMGVLSAS